MHYHEEIDPRFQVENQEEIACNSLLSLLVSGAVFWEVWYYNGSHRVNVTTTQNYIWVPDSVSNYVAEYVILVSDAYML